jgi:vacuolar-type H+-ATPase subunit D/Vma8
MSAFHFTTVQMIDALVKANTTGWPDSGKAAFREALEHLVKLAQAEQLLAMRCDMVRAVGLDPNRG